MTNETSSYIPGIGYIQNPPRPSPIVVKGVHISLDKDISNFPVSYYTRLPIRSSSSPSRVGFSVRGIGMIPSSAAQKGSFTVGSGSFVRRKALKRPRSSSQHRPPQMETVREDASLSCFF